MSIDEFPSDGAFAKTDSTDQLNNERLKTL